MYINPNSRDNKGSWRILKNFYCLVTMLGGLGLNNHFGFSLLHVHCAVNKKTAQVVS